MHARHEALADIGQIQIHADLLEPIFARETSRLYRRALVRNREVKAAHVDGFRGPLDVVDKEPDRASARGKECEVSR